MNIRPSTGFSSPSPSFGPRSVVVLMSGGVDSSVTAWLLKKEGWHVAGLTMRIPGQDGGSSRSCCGRDAAEVARHFALEVLQCLFVDQADEPFFAHES